MSLDTASYDGLNRKLSSVKRDLEHSLDEVRSKLSDIEDAVEQLEPVPRRLDSLEYELQEAKQELERVESDLYDTVSEVQKDMARASRRIAAVERRLRASDGAFIVDLDADPGGELRKLAATAQQGLTAQQQVLPQWERASLEAPIGQLSRTLAERGEQRRAVLQAAAVLASTPPGHPKRKAAEQNFRAAAPKAQQAESRLEQLRAKVEENRADLVRDDAARTKHHKAISSGQRASAKLRMALRSRLSEAITGSDLLPVWFVTAFGPLPPARKPDEWIEAATELLAYRVTYQVADKVVPLGPAPSRGTAPRRHSWHQELTKELKRWA
ncbi:hypothetical protein GCM10010271_67620 [Streptomyces kurssanovii]|nr:hypothetical protein GCM10010271_67620 [Streptomyces kurssanovii]